MTIANNSCECISSNQRQLQTIPSFRHCGGVLRVQKELKANENGEAVYDFSYQTAVMVTERKSPRADRMIKEAIDNGLLMENEEKRSQKGSQKRSNLTISEFPTPLVKNVYEAIKMKRKAKYSWLADNLGVSEATIKRAIADLKNLGYINSEHSKLKGEWQLMK